MAVTTLVGIDVSARSLAVCIEAAGESEMLEFANNPAGYQKLVRRLSKNGRRARVVVEASGIYSFDLAFALHQAARIQVMLANPRAVRDFAKALLKRSKTDPLDAAVLLEFARRMPFISWTPPSPEALALRALARRIGALVKASSQEKSRLHAARHCQATPAVIRNDIEVNIRHLRRRIQRLEDKAVDIAWDHPQLRGQLAQLISVKGIARSSAVKILAELAVMPQDMTVRQWVAHAGLDPRSFESGQSVNKPPRISHVGNQHLRSALFMPALVAVQHEPNVQAFYEKLLARGKKPKQAVVAVMRKLLHSIYGMLKHGTDFDGELFYEIPPEKA